MLCHLSPVRLCASVDHPPPGSSVHGILQARIGGGCCALLQGIFPTQRSNPCLSHPLHCQASSLPLAPPGKSLKDPELSHFTDGVNLKRHRLRGEPRQGVGEPGGKLRQPAALTTTPHSPHLVTEQPSQILVHPEPQDLTLFGNRICVDAISSFKMQSHWISVGPDPMTGNPIRRESRGDTQGRGPSDPLSYLQQVDSVHPKHMSQPLYPSP